MTGARVRINFLHFLGMGPAGSSCMGERSALEAGSPMPGPHAGI